MSDSMILRTGYRRYIIATAKLPATLICLFLHSLDCIVIGNSEFAVGIAEHSPSVGVYIIMSKLVANFHGSHCCAVGLGISTIDSFGGNGGGRHHSHKHNCSNSQ